MTKNVTAKTLTTSAWADGTRRSYPEQAGYEWPELLPSYTPVMPRLAAFGLDTVGGATTSANVFYVTSLGSGSSGSSVGTRTYEGTLRYALEFSGDRVIIPCVSGVIRHNPPGEYDVRPGNVLYAGQCAPTPGLYFRGLKLTFTGSDQVIMHGRFYMGDDAGGLAIDERDGAYAGYFSTPRVSRQVFINCEFAWTGDELFDASQAQDLLSFVQCAFIEPLRDAGHPDGIHHFGPIIGGVSGERCADAAMLRCLFAHSWYRQPLTRSFRYAHGNCLHYNWGNDGSSGSSISVEGHDDGSTTQHANVVHSLFVKGPNMGSNTCIEAGDTGAPAILSGSKMYLYGNVHHGLGFGSQSAFVNAKANAPSGYVDTSTVQTTARPDGWGSTFQNLAAITDTTAGKLDFVDRFRTTVGAQPRTRSGGRVSAILTQIENAINGAGGTGGHVDTVSDAGGWPTVAEITMDPGDSGDVATYWQDDPVPTIGEGRDTTQASGLTKLHEWVQRRHAQHCD